MVGSNPANEGFSDAAGLTLTWRARFPAYSRVHSGSLGLEIRSVDRANQVLRIIGKGDKERLVLLPQPVLDELGTLWRTHRNPRWLFPNRCGDGPLNQRVLSHTFAAAADAAGFRHGVTSHALRHSYATRLIANGVDIQHGLKTSQTRGAASILDATPSPPLTVIGPE